MKSSDLTNTTNKAAFYERITSNESTLINRFDLYKRIQSDFEEETRDIQLKYAKALQAKWQGEEFKGLKSAYQKDKISTLSAAGFTVLNKEAGAREVHHSGIINLDIDDLVINTKEELDAFRGKILEGKVKFVEACFRSVSGIWTGAFNINVRVDIPAYWGSVDNKLKGLLNLEKGNDKNSRNGITFDTLNKLHKAYHKALSHLIFETAKIKVGSSKDLKRNRYLSNDRDIYVNADAKKITQKQLVSYLEKIDKVGKEQSSQYKSSGVNIDETDAFKFAHKFAEEEVGGYGKGNKHNYLTSFCICCNLLGVDQDEVEQYIKETYPDKGKGNFLSYPYSNYQESHGSWAWKLINKRVEVSKEFELKKGEYIGDYWVQLLDVYINEWENEHLLKFDWKGGMGTGKSTVVRKQLAPALLDFTGKRTIIVYPLNALAEKQSISENEKHITANNFKDNIEALDKNIIYCNQNALPLIDKHFKETDETFHIFIDESHDLVNGMSYKQKVVQKAWSVIKNMDSICASVTLMSGTPKDYFNQVGFKRLDFKKLDRPPVKLHLIEMTDKADMVALNHSINANHKTQVLGFLQSKKSIDNVVELLNKNYSKTGDEAVKLYSEKHVKETAVYNDLMNANKGDKSLKNARWAWCTSFVEMGVDFYGDNIESVYINNQYYHNLDSVLQFADRWRTEKSKDLYYYYKKETLPEKIRKIEQELEDFEKGENVEVGEEKEQEIVQLREKFIELKALQESQKEPYNHRAYFEQTLKEYKKQARYYNKRLLEENFKGTVFNTLKTQVSESNFLNVCSETNVVTVNELYIMKLVEQERNKNMTLDRFKKEIEEHYPYVEIIETEKYEQKENVDETLLKDLKKAKKKKEQEADNFVYDMLNSNQKHIFLQALKIKTDDSSFKKLVPNCPALKDDAIKLIEKHEHFFKRFVNRGVTAYAWIKHLMDLYLLEDEAMNIVFSENKKTGQKVLTHNRKFGDFKYRLKIQLLRLVNTIAPHHLNKFQKNDADKNDKIFQKLYEDITKAELKGKKKIKVNEAIEGVNKIIASGVKKAKDKRLSMPAKDLLFTVLDVYNRYKSKIVTGISQRQAVSLIGSLFDLEYKSSKYYFNGVLDISDILGEHGIDSVEYKNRIISSLDLVNFYYDQLTKSKLLGEEKTEKVLKEDILSFILQMEELEPVCRAVLSLANSLQVGKKNTA